MKPQSRVCLPHRRHVRVSYKILPLGGTLGKRSEGRFLSKSLYTPHSSVLMSIFRLHRWNNSERKGNSQWYYCDLNIWSYGDLLCVWKEGSQPLMPFGRLKNRLLVGYYFTSAQHLRFARDQGNCRVNLTVLTVVCIRIKDIKETWVFSYILTQLSKMWCCSKLLSRNVLCLLSDVVELVLFARIHFTCTWLISNVDS